MSPLSLLLLLLLSFRSFRSSAVLLPLSTKLSPYEVLASYHLPAGLLPVGALDYDLNPDTGEFTAYFNGTCAFSLEGSYQLRYQSTISGRISTDHLRDLRGVSVKVLFFWVNIVEVVRNDDKLEFSVGIASADFSIDNFYECPRCGCGLECVNLAMSNGQDDGMRLRAKEVL